MRRALKFVGLAMFLVMLIVIGFAMLTFGGLPPIEDGRELGAAQRVRTVKDGYVSAYVVDLGGGRVALVDAGMAEDGAPIVAELARRGLGADAVAAILLTHGHPDHVGAVAMFPGAAVLALAEEVALVEGRGVAHGPLTRWLPMRDLGARVSRSVRDGEVVTLGERTFEAFAVPGHTAGSVAWLVDGVLLMGDSADATKEGTMVGAKWLFTDDPAKNHAALVALAARLAPRRAEVVALAFSHTGMLAGIQPLLDYGSSSGTR